ncbi:MAG: V-type ATP synthase subunit E [Spirochaetales bacterium]|nr:V-type ATP synthase subunit E [Spirochaetales bacterium]
MEIQIQDLVQSIKRDGIEEARKEADTIVAAAKAQAAEIVAASKAEAQKNIDNANREIESSKALIKQAERDAVLSVKKELELMLERIMADKVSKDLSEKSLAALITAAINGDDPAKYSVEIDEAKAAVKASLAQQIEKGLEIRPVKGMSGMKLCCKDGSGFYDFSDEEIAALLRPFLGDMKI